jgi:hypothetical protein
VLVKHILDLVTRGFPSRLAAVADMANSLRAERNLGQVGINWPSTFVKRCPELTTKPSTASRMKTRTTSTRLGL